MRFSDDAVQFVSAAGKPAALCCRGVVAVPPPRRVVGVENAVAVVRGDGGVERHGSDLPPVGDRAELVETGAAGDAGVGGLDAEGEAPLRSLVDLGHDLV